MADAENDSRTIAVGMAGLTLVGDGDRGEAGALLPRNLGEAAADVAEGVFLESLAPQTTLQVRTAHHLYQIRRIGARTAEISGHPDFCPRPVAVRLRGARWLDTEVKECYIAPGMRLHFGPRNGPGILTSPIRSVRVAPATDDASSSS